MVELKEKIEILYEKEESYDRKNFEQISKEFINSLNEGIIRAAERQGDGSWIINVWVKKGILLLFKYGNLIDYSINSDFRYFDKHTLTLHPFSLDNKVRIVPGGSSIRTGCYIAKDVICMPPMYINIGAYVDEGTMIDSHALVGTCGQVGKRVHLSAGSQIGGVLEPPGARPVIIEDDVLIGGNCGIYEGVLVRERAVLASGVILTSSIKVYDLVNEKVLKSEQGCPLEIPSSAVVVPGARVVDTEFGRRNGLSISSPMIIKYRDAKTDAKTALEDLLRE
jgi:2,3,4,5-tetrahydropyridine-2-carboxylate N-succinyltransferase